MLAPEVFPYLSRVHRKFLHGLLHPLRDRGDDPLIGLVQNKIFDIVRRKPCLRKHMADGLGTVFTANLKTS